MTGEHRTGRLRGLLLALALLLTPLLSVASPALAAPSCVTSGATVTCTFSYTGAPETWTVPAGVTSATFDLYGAQGGIVGGLGGRLTATLSVTPGATYQIRVSGSGDRIGPNAGFNGGGLGQSNRDGGDASDVRSGAFTLAERLLVAGGGGGTRATGGAGGYPNGGAGVANSLASGGSGGTQSAGGAGGAGDTSNGSSGSLGQGGSGGGYYGGGSATGGGGSSYATPAATSVSYETSVRAGDGLMIISYSQPLTDTTAPVASPTQSSAAAPSGWNNTNVTVSWNWSDPVSGAAPVSGIDPASCTTSSVSSGSGTIILSATCTDLAGNTGTASYQVRVDPTAPTANPSQSPATNASGWNNTDVTVSWNWSDSGSSIDPASCTISSASSGEGEQILSATCNDSAGNQGSASYAVKVDTTAPTITAATTTSLNAAGWYRDDVTVSFSCADALSGLAGACPPSQTLTGEGTAINSTARMVSDLAGNTSAPSNIVTVKIDRTAPTVSVTGVTDGATYLLGSVPTAGCSTSDALAGVATQASLTRSGGSLGLVTATCASATDNAGNSAPAVSVSYRVAYGFVGFFQPVDNLPTINTANAGRSIPLKWRVLDGAGNPVTNLASVSVTSVAGGCSAGAPADIVEEYATSNTGLMNQGDGYYQFNWQTEKSWAGSCRTLRLDLGDGVVRTALFQFM